MFRPLLKDVFLGSIGFTFVSIAAFSVWAFEAGWLRNIGGELAMYAIIAAVFLSLSGLVLGPLAGGVGRFYKAFLPSFFVYAVVWTAAWFALPDKRGECIGATAGCLVFAWIAMKMLGGTRGWLVAALALFVLHTAGYFAGHWAMYDFWLADRMDKKPSREVVLAAKLSWGLFYGLGFGAGIGWVFNRARIAA